MLGEDNVLLGHVNTFSAVTDNVQPTIIAAANTQHLFRLISEIGGEFTTKMRQRSERKLNRLFSSYYKDHLQQE